MDAGERKYFLMMLDFAVDSDYCAKRILGNDVVVAQVAPPDFDPTEPGEEKRSKADMFIVELHLVPIDEWLEVEIGRPITLLKSKKNTKASHSLGQ